MSFADDLRVVTTKNLDPDHGSRAEGVAQIYTKALRKLCEEAARSGKHGIRGYVDVCLIDGINEGLIRSEILTGTFARGGTRYTWVPRLINDTGFTSDRSDASYEQLARDVCKAVSRSVSSMGFSRGLVRLEMHPEVKDITGGLLGHGRRTGRKLSYLWVDLAW